MDNKGFPMSTTRDGIDTSKHPEGIKNALKIEAEHKEWKDSDTGMPCPPPDYARED